MLAALALAGLGLGFVQLRQRSPVKAVVAPVAAAAAGRHPALLPGVKTFDTAHYRIHSTATLEQSARVAQAAESLYQRYTRVFPHPGAGAPKLTLVLYRDRAEFQRNNRSRPWAEAYYLPPRSYAYFDASRRNPHHWMLHEATHQLVREVSGFKRTKWVDEGLASYFGAGRLANGALAPDDADPDAYPIWWLPRQKLTGVLELDIASGQVIPLEQLISGRGGPDENRYFNQYYVHYWSLSHFLFHYRGGVYAERYRQLIAEGGTLENFRRIVGPPERIQQEWYGYLLQIVERSRANDRAGP